MRGIFCELIGIYFLSISDRNHSISIAVVREVSIQQACNWQHSEVWQDQGHRRLIADGHFTRIFRRFRCSVKTSEWSHRQASTLHEAYKMRLMKYYFENRKFNFDFLKVKKPNFINAAYIGKSCEIKYVIPSETCTKNSLQRHRWSLVCKCPVHEPWEWRRRRILPANERAMGSYNFPKWPLMQPQVRKNMGYTPEQYTLTQ